MRSLFLYNSILFLGLPFCDQKGSEKVSLLRGSVLGGQNGASRTPPLQVGLRFAAKGVVATGSRRSNEKRAAKTAVGCLEEVSPDSGSG